MTANPLLLAIDAGTTGVRAIVFEPSGVERGLAYEETALHCPRPGWVEADPLKLWESTRRVMTAAQRAAGAEPREIAAVGIANQRGTTVVWEKSSGRPIYPAIVWQDVRTVERVEALRSQGVLANTMASSTKVEWILEQNDGRRRAERGQLFFGTIDTWLAWNLSGGLLHITDSSNASCTGLYDYGADGWDSAMLNALAIPYRLLPRLADSSEIYGRCDADACGLSAPLAAIAGDQQASMFGLLRHNPGDFKVTLGTSAMLDVNTGTGPVLSRHGAYPLVLWRLRSSRSFCLEGAVIAAGAAIQWLRDGLGLIADARDSAVLASQSADGGAVWVIPAFQGLGTPYMEPDARALIGGLSRASTKADIVRATLDGIAFRCRQIIEALAGDVGQAMPTSLRVDGGAAANDFLLQRLADVVGVPVERPQTTNGTALGAALLAGMAIGLWAGIEEVSQCWRAGAVFEPLLDPTRVQEEYGRWRVRADFARPERGPRIR